MCSVVEVAFSTKICCTTRVPRRILVGAFFFHLPRLSAKRRSMRVASLEDMQVRIACMMGDQMTFLIGRGDVGCCCVRLSHVFGTYRLKEDEHEHGSWTYPLLGLGTHCFRWIVAFFSTRHFICIAASALRHKSCIMIIVSSHDNNMQFFPPNFSRYAEHVCLRSSCVLAVSSPIPQRSKSMAKCRWLSSKLSATSNMNSYVNLRSIIHYLQHHALVNPRVPYGYQHSTQRQHVASRITRYSPISPTRGALLSIFLVSTRLVPGTHDLRHEATRTFCGCTATVHSWVEQIISRTM